MRSFLAALRSLVLPYGRTEGARIIIDGDNGRILVYDAAGDLVNEISAQALSGGASLGTGIATYGDFGTAVMNDGRFRVFQSSPGDDSAEYDYSSFTFYDGVTDQVRAEAGPNHDSLWISKPIVVTEGETAYVKREMESSVSTSNTGNVTAEAITDTVAPVLVPGRTYEVEWTGSIVGGSSAPSIGDRYICRIRQDSLVPPGTIMDHNRVWFEGGGSVVQRKATLKGRYTAVAGDDSGKTFHVTWERESGTGNIVRHGNSNRPSILTVTEVA